MATFRELLKRAGFDSYDDYLSGEHWRSFRDKYKQSDLPQFCLVCRRRSIQLHHCSYQNLGHESLVDVMPLCDEHHLQVHKICKHNRWPLSRSHDAVQVIAGVVFERPVRQAKPKSDSHRKERSGVHQLANQLGMGLSLSKVLALGDGDYANLIKEVKRLNDECDIRRRERKCDRKKKKVRRRAHSQASSVGSSETVKQVLSMTDDEFDSYSRKWQAIRSRRASQLKAEAKAEYAKIIESTPIFVRAKKLADDIQALRPARSVDADRVEERRIKEIQRQARRAGVRLSVEQAYALTPSLEQEIINLAQRKQRQRLQRFRIAIR